MRKVLRVLLIEDSEDDCLLISRQLRKAGYDLEFERVETREEMVEALSVGSWDVILSDFNLPQFSATGALNVLKDSGMDLPFIIVSRAIGEETAVELMKAGAHDYILKDHLARLIPAIEREIKEARVRRERSEAELEKGRLLEELREAVRARDEFLSVASHELKTPITPLKLHIQMLKRMMDLGGRVDPEKLRQLLTTADRAVLRLSRLVEELLDVSRISTGRMNLICEDVHLSSLLQEYVAGLIASGEAHKGDVRIVAKKEISGRWDRIRIEQVVSNLISNALRYGHGETVQVEIDSDGVDAFIRVIDRGAGIDPKDHARIFQRFERASSTQNFGGLGLGLYIVRQIVELHGGRITVESEPGRGSVFTVRLPIQPQALAAAS